MPLPHLWGGSAKRWWGLSLGAKATKKVPLQPLRGSFPASGASGSAELAICCPLAIFQQPVQIIAFLIIAIRVCLTAAQFFADIAGAALLDLIGNLGAVAVIGVG